jgi:hypothetical protein
LGIQERDDEGVFGDVDPERELTIHDCVLTKTDGSGDSGPGRVASLTTRGRGRKIVQRNTNPGVAIFARRSTPQAQVAMPRFVFFGWAGASPCPANAQTTIQHLPCLKCKCHRIRRKEANGRRIVPLRETSLTVAN